ncbi:MAG: recombinase family protein [Acidimicrobiales bacterium]
MEPEQTLRAAIYTRLSSGAGESLDRQETACQDLCSAKGWRVVESFREEDTSAFREKARPLFDRMLLAGEAGQFDVVVCFKLDRIARRVKDVEAVFEAGLMLSSVNDSVDTTTATGRALVQIITVLAGLESETIKLRVKSAKRDSAMRGDAPHGGLRPFGLTDDWGDTKPYEQKLLVDVANRIIQGDSLNSCVRFMQESGIPPTGGGEWTIPGLRHVLRSRRMVGDRTHLGKVVMEDAFPAMLDRETFDLVQLKLSDPTRKVGPRGEAALLAGVAKCGYCGSSMRRLASKRTDGTPVVKYTCNAKRGACANKVTCDLATLDGFVMSVLPVYSETWMSPIEPLERQAERLRAQLVDLGAMWANGEVTKDEWMAARKPLMDRLRVAEDELQGSRRPEFTTTRGYVRSLLDGVYVLPVGKGVKVPIERRIQIIAKGKPKPDLPLWGPLPEYDPWEDVDPDQYADLS